MISIQELSTFITLLKTYSRYCLMIINSACARKFALILLLILSVFTFRYNILTIFYIGQTYLTWHKHSSTVITSHDNFDTTMSSYLLNQTSAKPNYTDMVPAILHHIVIGNINLNERPTWLAAREACLQWHPNYEHRFWNDSSAEKFILEEYSWFLETWKNYPYAIQRADSLRYLVLFRYGGIFLDMDLHCRRSLGPLRRFEFVSPAAYPVGISNGFLMASVNHPFLKVLVDQLPLFNRNFILPYATVMFSTGCMYISTQFTLNNDRYHLRTLDYKLHRLNGHVSTPLFQHYGSSSWHSSDASFIKIANTIVKKLVHYQRLDLIIFFILIIFIFTLFCRKRTNQREKNDIIRRMFKKMWHNKQKCSINQFDEMNEVLLSDTYPNKRSYRLIVSRFNMRPFIRFCNWIYTHQFLFIMVSFFLIPILLYLLLLVLSSNQAFIPKQFEQNHHRLLLVVAHPDDECLFFAPTLRVLERQYHVNLSLLVFSRGNHVGLGQIRAMELLGSCSALNIPNERCISLDLPNIQDNPTIWWSEQQLIPIINDYINKWSIDLLISFDNKGISGHINHRAVASAVHLLTKNKNNTMIKMSYELKSVSILRKYLSLLDCYLIFISFIPRLLRSLLSYLIPFNLISSPNLSHMLLINTPSDYIASRTAFASHKSQYNWDRYIYLIASRYMLINELKYISYEKK